MEKVYISLEFTPNPNTLKYSVNRKLLERGAAQFADQERAKENSPLAARLFEISGISGVMIGTDFVTITKAENADWDHVHKSVSQALENHLTENLPILSEAYLSVSRPNESEIERKIREILDREIRPAVAMDGGDISLDRFEEGVVYVFLQGSCSGCPSSTATLKMGVEARLKQVLPEVKEVVSV